MSETAARGHEFEAEVIAEEDAEPGTGDSVRALEPRADSTPVIRGEVRTAALAAAGGVLAGAVTVAAVRAVGGAGKNRRSRGVKRSNKNLPGVVASRSFLIDVHLLDR